MEPKEDNPNSATSAGLPVSEQARGSQQAQDIPAPAPQQQYVAPVAVAAPVEVAAPAPVAAEEATADW